MTFRLMLAHTFSNQVGMLIVSVLHNPVHDLGRFQIEDLCMSYLCTGISAWNSLDE